MRSWRFPKGFQKCISTCHNVFINVFGCLIVGLLFGFSLFFHLTQGFYKIQLCLQFFVIDPVLALGQVMVVWCVRVLPG